MAAGSYIDPTTSMTYFLDANGNEINVSGGGTPVYVNPSDWLQNGFWAALGQQNPGAGYGQAAAAQPTQRAYTGAGNLKSVWINAPAGPMSYIDWINAGEPGAPGSAAQAAPSAGTTAQSGSRTIPAVPQPLLPGQPPSAAPTQPPANPFDAGAPGVQPAPTAPGVSSPSLAQLAGAQKVGTNDLNTATLTKLIAAQNLKLKPLLPY